MATIIRGIKIICKILCDIRQIEEQRLKCQKIELALKKGLISEKEVADFLEIDIDKINKERYFI